MSLQVKIILLFTILFTLNIVNTNAALTHSAKISLLTCSSGEELYSSFGHSALRVKDDSLDLDVVFNYGTFDFDTPFFIPKFIRGDLDYMLSVSTMARFARNYERENREVVERQLKLTPEQRQRLFELLAENAMPQNRYYRYDFFYDNCATRIRDLVFRVTNQNDSLYRSVTNATFRDLLHICNDPASWSAQGVDLVLGAKTDACISPYDKAYLPIYLDSLFLQAGLVDEPQIIIRQNKDLISGVNFIGSPLFTSLLILLFTILFTYIEFRKHIICKPFDYLLFTSAFLVGLLFWFLWLCTNHSVVDRNINVLWASVLYLPIVIKLIRTKNINGNKSLRLLSALNLLFLALFVMLTIFGVQGAPSLALVVALALAIRNVSLFIHAK